jgi:hypothetical protein
MVNFFIERGRRHRSSKFFFLYHQSSRIVSKMGKCWKHCQFPLLSVEASQHRCFNCSKKFHALCSSVRHPRAVQKGSHRKGASNAAVLENLTRETQLVVVAATILSTLAMNMSMKKK